MTSATSPRSAIDEEQLILEAFAGPGGWSEALHRLGVRGRIVGFEWDRWAALTAMRAGHLRVRADVAQVALPPPGVVTGMILSPPCQPWSRSGKGLAKLDQPRIWVHLAKIEAAGEWVPYPRDGWHDDRSPLVLEVLRWVLTSRPVWFACEQVPDVLPFWKACARIFRRHGYTVAAGVVSCERYGLPQTRERAILAGARDGRPVRLPEPTHTEYRPHLPDGGRWHGTDTTGGDLFGEALHPWVSMADALGWGSAGSPSATVTAGGTDTGGAEVIAHLSRYTTRPDWVLRTGNNSMVTGRTGTRAGDVQPYERPVAHPTPTLDTQAGNKWTLVRPATTVQGDPRIAAPGHRDREGGARQFDGESVRVTVDEAATLQGFAPREWCGPKSARYRQIGDAVPPPLGAAVLGPAGLDVATPTATEAAA